MSVIVTVYQNDCGGATLVPREITEAIEIVKTAFTLGLISTSDVEPSTICEIALLRRGCNTVVMIAVPEDEIEGDATDDEDSLDDSEDEIDDDPSEDDYDDEDVVFQPCLLVELDVTESIREAITRWQGTGSSEGY
jgi:hypothetical protein